MPFYEYQCKNCGHALEAMQKISEAPLKKCPSCGKSQLQRLMSAPVFRLKGGGWYETDFKGDQDNKRNLADRPEADTKDEKTAGAEAKKDEAKEPAKAAEKPSDNASDKSTNESAKKAPATGGSSTKRAAPAKPAKSVKKAVKKPQRKAKKR